MALLQFGGSLRQLRTLTARRLPDEDILLWQSIKGRLTRKGFQRTVRPCDKPGVKLVRGHGLEGQESIADICSYVLGHNHDSSQARTWTPVSYMRHVGTMFPHE
jgi:hypothetical protein